MSVDLRELDNPIRYVRVAIYVCAAIAVRVISLLLPEIRIWVVFLGVACLFITQKGTHLSDKAIAYLAVAVGAFPVLGWLPHASRVVDPILALATTSIVAGAFNIFDKRVRFDWQVLPIAIAITFGIQRFWSFTVGTSSEIFARLFSGWDHFGHFYLFINSVRFDSFVVRAPNLIPGMTAYDRQYPAGIQMNWSQWWPQSSAIAENHPVDLLGHYIVLVILSAGMASLLIYLSIIRIFDTARVRFVIGIGVSIAVYSLIFLGPLSITIWNGFPNFSAAISGVVIACSLLYRPMASRHLQLLVLGASIGIAAYNWHPLLVPVGLAVATYVLRTARDLGRSARWWYLLQAFVTTLLVALPVIGTFAFGVKHLTVDGGINQLPANMVVTILGFSLAVGIFDLGRRETSLLTSLFSPLLIAPLFQIAVTTYVRLSEQSYPYYVQKIAMGMVFVCLAVFPMRFATGISSLVERRISQQRLSLVLVTMSSALVGLGVSQLFGYIGPDWTKIAPVSTSPGVYAPQSVEAEIPKRLRTTNILVSMSDAILAKGPHRRDCFVFNDIDMQDYDPVLANYWVGVLTWTLTEEHLVESQSLGVFKTGVADVSKNVKFLKNILDPQKDCPIVSRKLALELVRNDAKWVDVLWVIEDDGHVSKFRE